VVKKALGENEREISQLTKREVMTLKAEGLSNKEIAY